MVKRTERVRLYPTKRQRCRLEFTLDVTRELYNALLEQRRECYRRRRLVITTIQQYHEITVLRKEDGYFGSRLRAVYRECLDGALHRLDLAFTTYFNRLRSGETAGYPRYKSALRWSQIAYCHGSRALILDAGQHRLRVPGIGWIRLRRGRAVPRFGRAWLTRKNGRWYAVFECDRPRSATPALQNMVGVDRGIRVLIACSDGIKVPNPRFARRNAAVIQHEHALHAATLWGPDGKATNRHDRERCKAAQRLSRARERERNARRDYLHKCTRALVNNYAIIALEKLNVRRMTRSARGSSAQPGRNVRAKAGLNRAMLDASFGLCRSLIVAKAEEAGRRIVEVNPQYTSQTCSACSYRSPMSRRGDRFVCVECGYSDDADVNAAKVILIRAQSALKSEPDPGAEPGSRVIRCSGLHDEDTELVINKTTPA